MFIDHGERQNDTRGTFIIGFCYISKSLLTSCVPYLQFQSNVIAFDHLGLEINANCSGIGMYEFLLCESSDE